MEYVFQVSHAKQVCFFDGVDVHSECHFVPRQERVKNVVEDIFLSLQASECRCVLCFVYGDF